MISIVLLEAKMIEKSVPKDPELNKMVRDPKVKKFINMSKGLAANDKKTADPQEFKTMLDDPKIQDFLKAAEKIGKRIGWIQGSFVGTVVGGTAGAGISILTGVASLALLGAIAGGLSIGFLASKIMGILRRWKAEEQVTTAPHGTFLQRSF